MIYLSSMSLHLATSFFAIQNIPASLSAPKKWNTDHTPFLLLQLFAYYVLVPALYEFPPWVGVQAAEGTGRQINGVTSRRIFFDGLEKNREELGPPRDGFKREHNRD